MPLLSVLVVFLKIFMISGYILELSTTCESVQYERNVLNNLCIGFISTDNVKLLIIVQNSLMKICYCSMKYFRCKC